MILKVRHRADPGLFCNACQASNKGNTHGKFCANAEPHADQQLLQRFQRPALSACLEAHVELRGS